MTLASETTRPTFPAQALSPDAAAYPGPMVAIRKLRELKWLSPSQTLVMFALIGRVHNITGETPAWCAPSLGLLADDVHVSVSTVQRALTELEERGLVRITRRWGVGRSGQRHRIASLYRIVLPGYEDASRAPLPPRGRAQAPEPDTGPPKSAERPIRPAVPLVRDESALTVDDMADVIVGELYRHEKHLTEEGRAVRDEICADGFLMRLAYQACAGRLTPQEVRSAVISFDIKHLMFTVTGDVPHLRRTLETYLRNEKRITKMALDRAVKCEIASIAQDRSMGRYVPWQSEEEIRASFVGFT